MGFDTYKFVIPEQALKAETELNIGYCKEIQKGVIVKDTDRKQSQTLKTVDWDECTEVVKFRANPEDTILNISKCRDEEGYDMFHDCHDGVQDISKCMEGKIFDDFFFNISLKNLVF